MTLDDTHDWREAARRDREHDLADRKAEADEQALTESIEAVESAWLSSMRQSAKGWQGRQHWTGT